VTLTNPPVSERRIELRDGGTLFCLDSGGTGEAVVLAHAHTGNALSWAAQISALAAAGYRAIAWSRRGYHGSGALGEGPVATLADDLAALLDQRGVAGAHLVGVAAGGAAVVDFALSFPDRALSASVVSSLMGLDDPAFLARLHHLRAGWFRALPDEVKELGQSFRSFCPEGVAEWNRIRMLNPAMPPPTDLRFLKQAQRTQSSLPGLAASRVPLLLMTGAADAYMPPRLLREVARQVPQARLQVIEDAAHAPHVETPDEFNRAVIGFIDAVSASGQDPLHPSQQQRTTAR